MYARQRLGLKSICDANRMDLGVYVTHFSASCRQSFAALALVATCFVPTVPAQAAGMSHIRQSGWEAMCARGDQPMNFCKAFSGPAQISYSVDLQRTLSDTIDLINARYSAICLDGKGRVSNALSKSQHSIACNLQHPAQFIGQAN